MKFNILSVLATTVALALAAPTPEATKCAFSCLTTFNKCMYEHQGNIALCREETIKELPSVSNPYDS